GGVIGVINASKKSRGSPFAQADLELLSIIGGQAAIAIENARLFESVKAHQKRAEELLQRSLLVQDEERRRISLEVHDSVAQWLVATYYMVQSCQGRLSPTRLGEVRLELQEVQQSLARSIGELRRIIADLHPVALRELGLVGALRRMTEALNREGMACHLNIEGRPVPLSQVVEMAAYRVAQEALSNVRKHSAATQVSVLASFKPEAFALEVGDNGRGFDLGSVMRGNRGLGRMGLVGMKERAESLRGSLKVETAEGVGTRVLLHLPLARTGGADMASLSPRETVEAGVHPTPSVAGG
ncbi:MAG: sensor histidine kinase, partial [Chloroflexota bacterium]|nr:sensor histidine kinase [Chloroflexota bacterium]